MKKLKYITIGLSLVTVALFYSCADLTPPYGGWLWVVTNQDDSPYNTGILKLNPSDGTMVDGLPAPASIHGDNYGLAYGNGLVWVTWGEEYPYYPEWHYFLKWLDPLTGEEGEPIELDFPPIGLAWAGQSLWVVWKYFFYKINPNTGAIEEIVTSTTYVYSRGLAWDGFYLWAPDNTNYKIYKIDPKSGEVIRGIKAPCDHMAGLAWDGGALWVNDEKNRYAYRVSPKDGDVLGSYYYPFDSGQFPYGLAFEFPDGTGN